MADHRFASALAVNHSPAEAFDARPAAWTRGRTAATAAALTVTLGLAAPRFVGSYPAVWALVGLAVHAGYQAHGSLAAGGLVIAAGVYEFTPLKRRFRRRCRASVRSGFEFGFCCVGSTIGSMLMLLALGVTSLTWMSAIAVLVLAQKLLPAQTAIDVPLAVAIVGLGVWIVLAPSAVPGLTPPL
ncbi:MAG TPA: DUF2182 domain-containing protein [Actinomycetes bacterium]|jgi:predicted metal-binding membrane protein|nr:DUF2182 domain-containing protein [Actinomycetes bacterium]